jgi:hypothetical protein
MGEGWGGGEDGCGFRQPLLFEGDLIARIQTRQSITAEGSTHRHG